MNLQGHVSEWQRESMFAIESFGLTLDNLARIKEHHFKVDNCAAV